MKRCNACARMYGDDLDFCTDDGTALARVADSEETLVMNRGYSPVPPPIPPNATAPHSSSPTNWLFLIIGILATALVGLGAYVVILTTSDRSVPEDTSKRTVSESPTPAASVAPPSSVPTDSKPEAPPPPRMNPSGVWTGNWEGRRSAFRFRLNVNESNGSVSGNFVWTLTRSSRPNQSGKEGLSATDYVQGTYDPSTRTMRLNTVRLDDPYGLGIIRDTYKIIISENGTSGRGTSKNDGRFQLSR